MNKTYILENELIWVDNIDSTNEYIKLYISENRICNGQVIITNYQSKGKGQEGNKWESEPGKNLLFSIYLEDLRINAEDQFLVSKAISLGICDYLNHRIQGFSVKWPNDIYYGNKKIAGILIENAIQSNKIKNSIIGIGINVNQNNFSESLPNPVSLNLITSNEYQIKEEIIILIDFLNKKLSKLEKDDHTDLNNSYLENLYRYKEVSDFITQGNNFKGKIIGVDKYGRLIIEDENGLQRVFGFKEVEFVV